jgi:hypothetical protein
MARQPTPEQRQSQRLDDRRLTRALDYLESVRREPDGSVSPDVQEQVKKHVRFLLTGNDEEEPTDGGGNK